MAIGVGIELASSAVRAVVLERTSFRRGRAGQQPSVSARPLSSPGAQGRSTQTTPGAPIRGVTGQTIAQLVTAAEIACDTSQPEALARALTQIRRKLHLSGTAVLGLPGTATFITTVKPLVPNVHRASLAVEFELQQHLPFELADAAWHYRWLGAVGNGSQTGRRSSQAYNRRITDPKTPSPQPSSSAVVVATRGPLLDQRLAACRRAGLNIQTVTVSPIALLNFWEAQYGTVSSRVAGRPVPGGSDVAPPTGLLDLSDERTAQWLIRTPGLVRTVAMARSSSAELGQELVAFWETLRGTCEQLPTTVWVVGSSQELERLQGTFDTACGLQLERLELERLVTTKGSRLEQPDRFVAAAGLALQGIDSAGISLNLLQQPQQRVREQQTRRTAQAISVVSVLAAVALAVSGMLEVRSRRLRVAQLLERQVQLYQALRPELRTLLQRQQDIERRSLQLQRLLEHSPALVELLSQIAAALPDTVWLSKFECSKSQPPGTTDAVQAAVVDGLLEGRANSFQEVTQFLDRLKALDNMATVKPLSTSVVTDEAGGKESIAFAVQVQRPLSPSAVADQSAGGAAEPVESTAKKAVKKRPKKRSQ